MNPTKQQFEQLIRQALAELNLNATILGTASVYDDPQFLCGIVSTGNGDKCVFIDFRTCPNVNAVVAEIKRQLS